MRNLTLCFSHRPRIFNEAIGGTNDKVYLVIADIGDVTGTGLDFIKYAHLVINPLLRTAEARWYPAEWDSCRGFTPCTTPRSAVSASRAHLTLSGKSTFLVADADSDGGSCAQSWKMVT